MTGGIDYLFEEQTVTFPMGTPSGMTYNFNVTIIGDDVIEGDEAFFVLVRPEVGHVGEKKNIIIRNDDCKYYNKCIVTTDYTVLHVFLLCDRHMHTLVSAGSVIIV